MKASNRSPPGRPNPTSAKAEVNKVAAQGKDKTETRQVQDKTKDAMQGKDKTVDGKQVQDRAKDGAQGNIKTAEARQVQDKTQTRQVQDSVTKGVVAKRKDAVQEKEKVMYAKQVPDKKEDTKDVVQSKNDVNGEAEAKDRVLSNAEVKDKDAVNVGEVKSTEKLNTEVQAKVTNDVTEVKDKTSDGTTKDQHDGNSGQLKDSVGDADDSKQTKDKTSDEGQLKKQENHAEQKSIDKIPNTMDKVDKTNEHQNDKGLEISDRANDVKNLPKATHDEATKQDKDVTSDVQHKNSSDQIANQTDTTNGKVTTENEDDDKRPTETKKENGNERQKNGNHTQNGNAHKTTRSKQKRNDRRRKYDGDDEESDDVDSGDQLAMDNELVRHLLPHMSPALLPKAMQPQNKARDYSSNSSEDEHTQLKKLSLNVIKESSEDENNGNSENSEEESDDEAPAPPPPSLSSLRRHSFHHFPAPPTKSQSKNAEKVRALLQAVEEEELEKISKKLGEKTDLVRQHIGHVENRLFEMFGDEEKKTININKFLMGLTATGMRPSDPRLKATRNNLKKLQENLGSEFVSLDVEYETFMGIISENLEIVVKAFSASFVIPDFQGFCKQVEDLYNNCYSNHSGTPAQYIPQLARYDSKSWGVSVCTVDGQRFSIGDVDVPFTIQSCSYVLMYAAAVGLLGTEKVHSYVGMEASGRYHNELCLDYNNKPHNPMINSGAIMTAAIIKPELSAADRFDFMFKVYKRLGGDEYLGFNNSVFLSERECADRNFALAYFMRENKCFPPNHKLQESLDFYFQLCSLEITAESGAVMAATLANGGLNPLTGDPVLTVDAVRNTLTLMHSCGMYNYSGQFAFHVGLPAKSGVSGCVLLVIPNTMGICLWSPPLDSNGNSCRGVQFCMDMVSRFNFHNFDNLRGFSKSKQDPRTANTQSKAQILFDLLFSAAAGDMSALKRHALAGTDMQAKDYDGRTALHVATSEGHDEMVEFLLNNCNVYPLPKDRWDRTPLDDAESFDHPKCAKLITDCCKKKGITLPMSYKAFMALTNKANGPLLTVTSS